MENKQKNLLKEFVIVDLETIGLEKESGKIIEIAAVLVEDWEIKSELEILVDPKMKVPRVITNLTGIRNADVAGKGDIAQALPKFLDFIGDLPIVGHNLVPFDKPYLEYNIQACGLGEGLLNPALDTLELAVFLMPELKKFKLEYLYERLVGSGRKQTHRAGDDCRMVLSILQEMKKVRDEKWDYKWLMHAAGLAKSEGWLWADFILEREEPLKLGKEITSLLPVENYLETLAWDKLEKIADSEEEGEAIDSEEVSEKAPIKISSEEIKKIFSPGKSGSLNSVIGKQYEYRKQQEDMACLIADSINDSRHLVIEAPTGCGKSLAYLAPAVFWSLKNNNEPTVIATYTNALQDQLSESDFEILRQTFSADIKIAVAKGREHYTCLRRFKKYIEEAFEDNQDLPLEPGRFSRKLSAVFLANWLIGNKGNNCDLDSVPYWLKMKLFDFKTGAINSTRETCQKRFCDFYGQCFVNRLKIVTREANVVVANHSLVFSDPWDNYEAFSILPHNFKVLVIDEAINIEDAATNASTATFARNSFLRLLSDFFGKKSSRKKGVLKRIEGYVETFGDTDLSERARKLRQSGALLAEDANALFAPIAFALRKRVLEYDDREEIFPQFLEESEIPLQNIASRLRETIAFLDACHSQYCRKERNGICNEVKIFQDEFRDYYNFIAVLKELNKNKYIFYRIASADLEDFSLNFCHKDVGRYLEENLYGKGLRSIVFTSATLTYEKSFDFVRKMWGLDLIPKERIVYERLPYLFDYGSQAALALVSDLPPRSRVSAEENDQKHYPESADFIKNILLANNGAALMLFNSKKDALKFGELLVDDLEENNIPLYSAVKSADPRIMSGGRTGIIEEFKAYPESCLLGTAGFREGVNVPGASLELVFIVQLPFSVPTDPIKNNRKLAYGGFSGYVIPHCIFSIKQAFGRLIRTKDDSGLVFIMDARVLSYAEKIGKNLPDGLRIFHLNAPGYAGFNKRLASTKGKKNRVLKILGDGGG